MVRVGDQYVGEIVAQPGTTWRPRCPSPPSEPSEETCFGAKKEGDEWNLTEPRAAVGFPVRPGEVRKLSLSFATPTILKPGTRAIVRIAQRNDRRILTGGVQLELRVTEGREPEQESIALKANVRKRAARRGGRRKR